ncbi:DNA gyrase inhibitor YacG [Parvibaculum sp.]|jgi:endogenous inhibitor of DNA gyrase (YacG/DUF329 family)|uniref:DNA gyrase inhibitor YacG n=1 Tax=Parvibaculum sp. TaxID=2024848 RepID=UPI000C8DF651|nr:DNA gyrase inhibitor YacG [Parvibaculum sp.]MAB14318.1 DNA gyrase inhibitor YacG [Parvibaculum sp.]
MSGKESGERDGKVIPLRAPRPCPICGKKSAPDVHPFCSKHCADVDLNRWLSEGYAIPAVEPPDDFDPESLDLDEEGERGGGR